MKPDEAGIVGLAPIPIQGDDSDSFIKALKADGVIDKALFAMFISKNPEAQPSTLQVGDWDTTFVAEGETVDFFPLALDGSTWAVDITDI